MSRKRLTPTQKKFIAERANCRCEYCQWWREYAIQSFEGDHIIPICKGGVNDLYNIAFACGGCNNAKADKTEGLDTISKVKVLLYNPRREQWLKHFKWSEDFTEVIGLTSTGRATIVELKMNRKELIGLRKIFVKQGIHPPTIY